MSVRGCEPWRMSLDMGAAMTLFSGRFELEVFLWWAPGRCYRRQLSRQGKVGADGGDDDGVVDELDDLGRSLAFGTDQCVVLENSFQQFSPWSPVGL